MYDLPPRFTSWLGAFRRGDWTRDHWYGVDVILHKQLLASSHRTHDPEEADFFFIPLHLSLGYYTHRYYFKHFTERSVKPLRDALKYVNTTWPYLRRHPKRHVMVMTQDQGNRFVRDLVPEAAPLIFLHHWGAPRTCAKDGAAAFPCRVDNGAQGDHVAAHDVTVPPFHGEQARLNRWIADRAKNAVTSTLDRFCSTAPHALARWRAGRAGLQARGRQVPAGARYSCADDEGVGKGKGAAEQGRLAWARMRAQRRPR